MHRRRGIDHRFSRRTAAGHRRADRRQRHRPASGARHRHRALSAHRYRQGTEGHRRDAGRRAESRARQAARSAAPRPWSAHGVQPVRRRDSVRRRGAARRQRFRRRSAGPHLEVQGLGDRSQRLHLLHHPGAGLGEDLRCHRRARLEDPSRLRQAAGTAEAPERNLRPHRTMDHDQEQVRGDGHPQQGRHPLRSDPVDEGTGGGPVAARHRHRGRGGSSRRAANTLSVGNPIKMSDSPTEVLRSPLLGEHTDEVLRQVLGFTDHQVAEIHNSGALDPPRKVAAE